MKENIERTAYRKYQLDWLASHGYSIRDAIKTFCAYRKEEPQESCIDDSIDDWEFQRGMNGELYVCFMEFLEGEYLDTNYMAGILTDSERDRYMAKRLWTIEKDIPLDSRTGAYARGFGLKVGNCSAEYRKGQTRAMFRDSMKRYFDVSAEDLENHYNVI